MWEYKGTLFKSKGRDAPGEDEDLEPPSKDAMYVLAITDEVYVDGNPSIDKTGASVMAFINEPQKKRGEINVEFVIMKKDHAETKMEQLRQNELAMNLEMAQRGQEIPRSQQIRKRCVESSRRADLLNEMEYVYENRKRRKTDVVRTNLFDCAAKNLEEQCPFRGYVQTTRTIYKDEPLCICYGKAYERDYPHLKACHQ
jgi:hypothetical protein